HFLWTQIIGADQLELFDLNTAARMAARAARLLAEWQIPLTAEGWSDRGDAAKFSLWFKQFRRECQNKGWLSRADLWSRLPDWIAKGFCAPQPVAFLLQKSRVPALTALQHVLGSRARSLPLAVPFPQSTAGGKQLGDFPEEADFAARWARGTWEANPSHSIAVFVADLLSRRKQIETAFCDAFYPGACRALLDDRLDDRLKSLALGPLAYHITAPGPLYAEPLLASALLLLEIAHPPIPTGVAGALLRSPWIEGAAAERKNRADADLALRRARELDVSILDLETASVNCPRLKKIWPAVRRVLQRKPNLDTFTAWGEFIGDLLEAFGWPGDQELNTPEQSLLASWKDALSELGALSLVADEVPFDSALAQLRRLLDSGSDPAGGLLAPVQILDATQAAGLEFESALVVGVGEEFWPPPPAGNPFVPLAIQRRYHVSGSSAHARTIESEQLTAELFGTSPSVAAVWSGRLSPLVRRFLSAQAAGRGTEPKKNSADLAAAGESVVRELEMRNEPIPENLWQGKTTRQSFKPALLEEQVDIQAPPFLSGSTARGGSGLIKSQSLCPFRAFAEYRLGSGSLDEGCLGFDVRDRGGHLHSVLEFVWQKLGSLDKLRSTPQTELQELVQNAAIEAVKPKSSSFGKIAGSVEIERLTQVTLDWLAIERERQQPFTVETIEKEQYTDLGGLRLRLRIDRVDRLRNGGLILIDYKSGEQKRKKLECPRPEEPQLLVYAAGIGDRVEGVVFAQLKRDDPRPVGLTREKHFSNTRTVDILGRAWDTRMAESHSEVERIAAQFKSGYSAVDPKTRAVCGYCAQTPLCRIHELRSESEPEEE
ncbi:MAG: PD-(D/E)XK nuclease family protein, partial [Acidobacteriaceae bacterium]|nr:PD-(D/E)XK nuclease family protein [Acidobacteriaceae bacterium]